MSTMKAVQVPHAGGAFELVERPLPEPQEGWASGTAMDSEDTLNFSSLRHVRPLTETFPLERANEAYNRMMSNQVRFRAVLTPQQK